MGGQNSKSSSDQNHQESRIREESRSPGPQPVQPEPAVDIQLNNLISEFLNFYEPNIKQLMDLAEKLEKCQAERRLANEAKKSEKVVAVVKGAGIASSFLAGGIPGLGLAARAGINAIGKVNTSKSLRKLKSLWEVYRGITQVLKLKMQDVVRGIDTHKDKRNVPDTDLFEVLKLKAKVTDAILTLNKCQRDNESENCTMVRQYRDQVELFKPTMERFREQSRSPGPGLAVDIQLNHSISEFLNFYEPNINQLVYLAEKLEKCQAERQRLANEAKKREKVVAVVKGAGIALSILADGIPGLGYVARLGINAIGKVNTNKSLKSLKSLWEEYRGITEALKLKMLEVVRGIEIHTDKHNAPDTDLFELLDLKSNIFYAIIALSECHQDNESENYKMVRKYRDKVELFKPAMERFSKKKQNSVVSTVQDYSS